MKMLVDENCFVKYQKQRNEREDKNVGEIIVSIMIGGCLVVSGVAMNLVLWKEAKKIEKESDRK